ncbi:MAG: adenine phosphoribosyltransferase [Actinomycetes bacterium]
MEDLRSLIRDIPDFPQPGVVFKDITPVLADKEAFARLVKAMADPFRDAGVNHVAGIEARGFTLAAPVALELGAGFVPVRKPGKLPYRTIRQEYALEYGTDSLEVHVDAITPGDRVLLVDDVIATGGTAQAAIKLLQGIGAEVVGFSVFIELVFLQGNEMLDGVPLHALVKYD